MSLFDFKDFLTLDEVGEYLVDNNYPDIGRSRVITLAKDLINEGKLLTAIYHRGKFDVELVFHHKSKEKGIEIKRIKQNGEHYLNTYSWLTSEYQYKLFKDDSTIRKGVSIKDFEEQRLYLEPNIKDYQADFVGDTGAEYCNLFIDNESYVLKLDDVRYYRPNLDDLFKKDADLAQPTIEQYKQHISELDNKLEQAKTDNAMLKKQLDDNKDLEPSSIAAVTRLLNVLFYKLDYDVSAHSGTLNKQLIEYSKHPSVNTSISKGFLVPWLKRVQQLRIDTKTGSHDRHTPL